ncbi:MAG: sialate O-acetylesterase [Muribaculaceae bacterium]|nr:sialate O-acetylesterase [Muribaculaceae bacterium]
MDKKIFIIVLAFLVVIPGVLNAKVKLASIYGDNMVLQQQSEVTLFGTGTPNKQITCIATWDNKKLTSRINVNGKWKIHITTPKAGGAYEIKFNDGTPHTVTNVLIGEVWICSGQSNMEMPVKGFRGQPVIGNTNYIVSSDPKRQLRMFTVKRDWSTTPRTDSITGVWGEPSSEVVANFSATGFFFGDLLQRSLNIPVGLIHSSWSASKIEAWMSREALQGFPEVELPDVNKKEFGWAAGTSTLLFNAMINPLKGFPIAGVIWYQGEANSSNPELYRKLFPAMVKQWRTFFKNENMPLYYVQIAPWKSKGVDETDWSDFRQVQLELMKSLPHLGMVTTGDAGDSIFIHPPYKIKVGERLAYWALSDTYGRKGFQCCGPIIKDYKLLEKGAVELTFDYGSDGLNPENAPVLGFEISGGDGVFKEAKAEIINGSSHVKVWHEDVITPVEVRYCYRNYKIGNLFNNAHIPASPFKLQINQ